MRDWGDKENALIYLERAVDVRDVWLVWLPVTPRFDVLHDDERFVKLLARVRPA
jgi:hypothetical protein